MMYEFSVISFDMEGTLIDHTYSRTIWEEDIPRLFSDKHQVPLEEAKETVFEEYAKVGELQPEWYDIEYWFKLFELKSDWRKLLEDRRDHVRLYKETRKILEEIRDKIPIIISSNTIREFLDVQIDVLGNYFDNIFSAPSDFNVVKKDEVFYNKVLKLLDLEPDQIVHVGDHYNFDYIAPKQIGIQAYHLERDGEKKGQDVVNSLEEFLRIINF